MSIVHHHNSNVDNPSFRDKIVVEPTNLIEPSAPQTVAEPVEMHQLVLHGGALLNSSIVIPSILVDLAGLKA